MDHEQPCPKCGTLSLGEYLGDHPCIDYYCEECGEGWCDTDEYMEILAIRADMIKDDRKYGEG